jgi:hypothetical protein
MAKNVLFPEEKVYMNKPFVVVVAVFHHRRIKRFVETFFNFDPGCEHDIYFVHNKFFNPKARENKSQEELTNISNLLTETKNKYNNVYVIERNNIGEDFGAYHHAKNCLLDQYKYFFFMNELTVINNNGWLEVFKNIFNTMPNVAAAGPQICSDGRYNEPWFIKSTYWAIRNSVLKWLIWETPTWRGPDNWIGNEENIEESTYWQEVKLVGPQIRAKGMSAYQDGSGYNWMNYVYANGNVGGIRGRPGLYD